MKKPLASTSRRHFLGSALASGTALAALPGLATAATPPPSSEKPVLRIAHLTDIHLKPTEISEAGTRSALRHVHALDPAPDLILNGGDLIMDALGASREKTAAQWELWHKIAAKELRLPVLHTIGNHDIWGWQKTKAGVTGEEPDYGKVWALRELGMAKPYYSVERGGWKLIVLDSVQERGGGAYKPELDEEQVSWLESELTATPVGQHVALVSHVPILGAGPLFFYEDIVKEYQFRVAGALMHQDVHRIKSLLLKFPQVKACLSGHTHLADRVDYNGITYWGNGAVCGSWWTGPFHETKPGYGLVSFYEDGRTAREYIHY